MANRLSDAADALLTARRTGKSLKAFPEGTAPRDMAEGYAIQRAVVASLGVPIAGYKISVLPDGGTMVAPILKDLIVADGATRSLAPNKRMGIELEFGFRFARSVAANADAATILAAIGETVVTLELCDSRFDTIVGQPAPNAIADMIANRGAVHGTSRPFDATMNFKGATCRQKFDGKVNNERTGSHPVGDPLLPLPLLPKALAAVGYTIEPGQFVITGSLTGISWVEAPLTVVGEIDGFGSVSVKLVA